MSRRRSMPHKRTTLKRLALVGRVNENAARGPDRLQIGPELRRYTPLVGRGKGVYAPSFEMSSETMLMERVYRPHQIQQLELPGTPTARGKKDEVPARKYVDYGRGIRRLGGSLSVFHALQAAGGWGTPQAWPKGAETIRPKAAA